MFYASASAGASRRPLKPPAPWIRQHLLLLCCCEGKAVLGTGGAPRSRMEPRFCCSISVIALQRAENPGLHPRSRGPPPRLAGLRVEPEPELLLEPYQIGLYCAYTSKSMETEPLDFQENI